MPNPKGDSDLVKLVRDLEAKRLARKESDAVLRKLDEDLQKVTEYYETERAKLRAKAEATHREIRVQDAQLRNVEELVNRQTDPYGNCAIAACGELANRVR